MCLRMIMGQVSGCSDPTQSLQEYFNNGWRHQPSPIQGARPFQELPPLREGQRARRPTRVVWTTSLQVPNLHGGAGTLFKGPYYPVRAIRGFYGFPYRWRIVLPTTPGVHPMGQVPPKPPCKGTCLLLANTNNLK